MSYFPVTPPASSYGSPQCITLSQPGYRTGTHPKWILINVCPNASLLNHRYYTESKTYA